MVVEVGPEVQQLVLEICRSPEQNVIQILPSNGADYPFHERMRQWNMRDGLDFCYFQYSQVGLPLVEPIKRIVIGAEEVRHTVLPSNGTVEHPTKCGTIDRSRVDTEANDADPLGPCGHGSIHTPDRAFEDVPSGNRSIALRQLAEFVVGLTREPLLP